jgi:hypothetical protein
MPQRMSHCLQIVAMDPFSITARARTAVPLASGLISSIPFSFKGCVVLKKDYNSLFLTNTEPEFPGLCQRVPV